MFLLPSSGLPNWWTVDSGFCDFAQKDGDGAQSDGDGAQSDGDQSRKTEMDPAPRLPARSRRVYQSQLWWASGFCDFAQKDGVGVRGWV